MTAPRDPIEAPATELDDLDPTGEWESRIWTDYADVGRPTTKAALRVWEEKPVGWTGQDWRTAVLAIEAAARDEGRREAVRPTVDEMATAMYGCCIAPPRTDHAQHVIDALWVAGRSSDPEPAPDLRAVAEKVAAYSWGLHLAGTPNEREAIDLIEELRATLRGAVPALQATGEPSDE